MARIGEGRSLGRLGVLYRTACLPFTPPQVGDTGTDRHLTYRDETCGCTLFLFLFQQSFKKATGFVFKVFAGSFGHGRVIKIGFGTINRSRDF